MAKSYTQELISTLRGAISNTFVGDKKQIAKYASGGLDNVTLDEAAVNVYRQGMSSIQDIVDSTITSLHASGSFHGEITPAQRKAAVEIAAAALNPYESMKSLASMSYTADEARDMIQIGNDVMQGSVNGSDIISYLNQSKSITNDAYDPQLIDNALYFSIAYNIGAAKQDDFAEAFFPTITLSTVQRGIDISIKFASIFSEYQRDVSGNPDDVKAKRIPIIKAIYNNEIFASDKNRLVPVFRDGTNDDKFVKEAKHYHALEKHILTAPLKLNTELSLLGISQTDEQLAKGVMDNTDALDSAINIDKIFFSYAKNDKTKEYFSYDMSMIHGRNFVPVQQGHNKEMMLQIKTDSIIFSSSNSKTFDGSESTALQELAEANYTFRYELIMNGTARTDDSTIAIYFNQLAVKEIRDQAGNVVAKGHAKYDKLIEFAQRLRVEGYTLEAFKTNSNLRTRGMMITLDRYNKRADVPFRTGIFTQTPVNNAMGDDGDAELLSNNITLTGAFMSSNAVMKLQSTVNALRQANASNILYQLKTDYPSSEMINPYFYEDTINLPEHIDSTDSNTRDSSIRSFLRQKIGLLVIQMYLNSNYNVAYQTIRGNIGGKKTVIIGTDDYIKRLLLGDSDSNIFPINDEYEAIVVSRPDSSIFGQMFITFGTREAMEADGNVLLNPLTFGACFWSPSLVFDLVVTRNNSTSRELHVNPRYSHVVFLPIMTVLNVTDISNVYSKLPVHTRAYPAFNSVPTGTSIASIPNMLAGQTQGQEKVKVPQGYVPEASASSGVGRSTSGKAKGSDS